MIKHCNNCSACCEVIAIDNLTHEDFEEKVKSGGVSAIHGEMMKPISRDEAYKRNPLVVSGREEYARGWDDSIEHHTGQQPHGGYRGPLGVVKTEYDEGWNDAWDFL